jgi:SAM-dependent methyltransferase
MTARYYPEIFTAVADEKQAKEIILTNEGPGADTTTRWAVETPYVLELVNQALALRPDMLVLDYGCGIGRVAKAMIDACGCSVVGVDISANMLTLARDYVRSDRFIPVLPNQFDTLLTGGLRLHAAIAIWALQHCLTPADDVARIRRSLVGGGGFFTLNMAKRAVPAVLDGTSGAEFAWVSDGIDVAALLCGAFRVAAEGEPDPARTPKMADAGAFWMTLRRD